VADDDGFIAKTENFWRNRGLEWSPEKALDHFMLYGPKKRAEAMDQIDEELRNFEPTTENLRQMMELREIRQNFDAVHHQAMKVGR
jgi:hypothetical protein